MTRADYLLISAAIRDIRPQPSTLTSTETQITNEVLDRLARALSARLHYANANFDTSKFLTDCEVVR